MTEDIHPYRAEPDPAFADRLEHRLLRRLAAPSDRIDATGPHDLPDDIPLVRLADPDPVEVARHRHRHRSTGWLAAAAVLIVAAAVAVVLVEDGGDGDRVTTTPGPSEVNGSIVADDGDGWPSGATSPVRPDYDEIVAMPGPTLGSTHDWDSFDPRSGSFLYMSPGPSSRVRILHQDGEEIAAFDCESSYCGGRAPVFGPGPDEVTLFEFDDEHGWVDPDGLRVVGWDGAERDTLGVAAAFTEGADGFPEQELHSVAWSPDGTRLAVATVPQPECDPSPDDPCVPEVWTFDRNGHDPQRVHTGSSDFRGDRYGWVPAVIADMAWSPDGRSLGVVVGGVDLDRRPRPRLDVIRFRPDGTVRTETLHVYGRTRPADASQSDAGATFAFAWSPDGTRIAVAVEGGVDEISAEDGRVLARHPGVGVDDDGDNRDLAWLPAD